MSWSHDQVLALLELYENRPCLYAVKTSSYKNKQLRAQAYEEMVKALCELRPGISVADVKNKINGLRTNFLKEHRKYIKSIKSGSGEDELYQPTLWYYDNMRFILEHITPRATIDSIGTEGNDQISNEESIRFYDNETDVLDNDENITIEYIEESGDEGTSGESRPSTSKIYSTSSINRPNKKKKCSINEAVVLKTSNDTMKNIAIALHGKNSDDNENVKRDHIDIFGDFVVSRLRKLQKEHVQNDAQERITAILFEAYKKDRM